MEKGYRDYGHDIDNTDSVLEAGLGFAVDLDKPAASSAGRGRCAQKAAGPLTRRLVQVLVKDPEPLLFHAEIVRRDGKPVGYVRAASYGHTLGGAVGLAMVEAGEPVDAGLDRRRRVEGRDRRHALPGARVAAPALRPDQHEDQGLTRRQPCGTSWSSAPGRPERRPRSPHCRRDPMPAC